MFPLDFTGSFPDESNVDTFVYLSDSGHFDCLHQSCQFSISVQKRIQSQQIYPVSASVASGINKSQSKTTKSLLLVLGIFISTYTLWLIIYYLTVNTYSDTVEFVQTVIDWLWQVRVTGAFYYKLLFIYFCHVNKLCIMSKYIEVCEGFSTSV